MRSRWNTRGCAGGGIFGGLLLLTIGGLFLLSNLGILAGRPFHTWWPVLLIVLGVAKLIGYGRWHEPRGPYNQFD